MFGAWMPYGLLVILVLLWGFKPFQAMLNSVTISAGWPLLHNHVMMMPPVVARPTAVQGALPVEFSFRRRYCLHVCHDSVSALLLRMSPVAFGRLLLSVCRQLFLPTLTVTAVLAMAFVMNYCGATATLGLAFCGVGQDVSLLQPPARLAGCLSDRLRYLGKCALRQSASGDGQPSRI